MNDRTETTPDLNADRDTPLCIFHAPCLDGFGAAWVVNKYFNGKVDFHPGVYGKQPPNVNGRDVIIVDFAYKRIVLEQMADVAKSLLVLDHHKTAQEDLEGLPHVGKDWPDHVENNDGMGVAFDMDRSGAGLTWDFFYRNLPRPKLIDHIEDRDLWKFELQNTRAIHHCLASHPYSFKTWTELVARAQTLQGISSMVMEGTAIERKSTKDLNEFLSNNACRMTICGVEVPAANVPYFWASEAGHILCKDEPFACTYYDSGTERVFSLRSDANGNDVAKIAETMGGGGHKNASGFVCDLQVSTVSKA